MATVAAGQIIGTVLKLSAPLKTHPLGWPTCAMLAASSFAMMAWLHWPLVWTLLGLGGLTCPTPTVCAKKGAPMAPPTR